MLKRTSLLLFLPLILLSCASTGNQTNQPEDRMKRTSGLQKIGILAKGMEGLPGTRGVNDSLTRLDGVQNVRIDLQSNRVTVTPHPSREFPLSSIPERIRAAGFVPDDMYIVARGNVVKKEGPTSFRIENWQRTFPLDMPDAPDELITLRANVQFDHDPPLLSKRPSSENTDGSTIRLDLFVTIRRSYSDGSPW